MLSSIPIFVALFAGLTLAIPADHDKVIPQPRAGCQYSYNFSKTGEQVYIRSPNWPSSYPANSDCKYTLTSPPGTTISMTCDEFNVEYVSGCTYDRMTVSMSGDALLRDGLVVCGQGTFSRTSDTNALAVGFKSDSSNPSSPSLFRFQCLLTVKGAPSTTVAPSTAKPVVTSTAKPVVSTTKAPGSPSGPLFTNQTCSCGTRNENTRIVGGTNAEVNEFPWRAALYSPNMGVFCGATIISPSWILTAAHCTAALEKSDLLYADVGDHDLTTNTEANNQLIKCDRIVQHAQYNNDTQDNDVALCHLETPLTYSRTIQPACLPWTMQGETFQGKTVTASGWGTTSSGGSSSVVLKKVDLPVKTTEECQKFYQDAITDNMFCTYSAGKDTCQGDSGGSIDYKEPTTGRYFAIGAVSWGVGCAGVNQPGVYAKVTNYLSWIQTNTAGEQFCR